MQQVLFFNDFKLVFTQNKLVRARTVPCRLTRSTKIVYLIFICMIIIKTLITLLSLQKSVQ